MHQCDHRCLKNSEKYGHISCRNCDGRYIPTEPSELKTIQALLKIQAAVGELIDQLEEK